MQQSHHALKPPPSEAPLPPNDLCSKVFGLSGFSLPVYVIVVLSLRLALLPRLASEMLLLADHYGGPTLQPLTKVPASIYAVLMEVMLLSLWYSAIAVD